MWCPLPPSAPRISDGDSLLLLPTPTASPYGTSQNGSPLDGRESYAGKGKASLDTMARQGRLPTPTSSLADHGGLITPNKGRQGGTLVESLSLAPAAAVDLDSTAPAASASPAAPRLLPTPTAASADQGRRAASRPEGPTLIEALMLPTPTSRDWKGNGRPGNLPTVLHALATPAEERTAKEAEALQRRRWPTPTVNDATAVDLPASQLDRDSIPGALVRAGAVGSLHPQFVEWMMGFPPGWTDLDNDDGPTTTSPPTTDPATGR